jgi:hypothetical protein
MLRCDDDDDDDKKFSIAISWMLGWIILSTVGCTRSFLLTRPQTRHDWRAYQYNDRAIAEDFPFSDVQARD